MSKAWLLIVLLITLHQGAGAAPVPVEDINSGRPLVTPGAPSVAPVNASAGQSGDTYYLLQLMREEIRQLQGLLEEQGHELAELNKKQRQDYLDLDSRIAAMTSSRTTPTGALPVNGSSPFDMGRVKEISASNTEASTVDLPQYGQPRGSEESQRAAYEKAYGLLKARKIDQARVALTKFKDDYPASAYTPNAQYWLGEIYLLQNELPAAAKAFRAVVEDHPGHRKVNDASFKLGKVYHLENKLQESRVLLEGIAKTSGSAAKLAQDYLARHF